MRQNFSCGTLGKKKTSERTKGTFLTSLSSLMPRFYHERSAVGAKAVDVLWVRRPGYKAGMRQGTNIVGLGLLLAVFSRLLLFPSRSTSTDSSKPVKVSFRRLILLRANLIVGCLLLIAGTTDSESPPRS